MLFSLRGAGYLVEGLADLLHQLGRRLSGPAAVAPSAAAAGVAGGGGGGRGHRGYGHELLQDEGEELYHGFTRTRPPGD